MEHAFIHYTLNPAVGVQFGIVKSKYTYTNHTAIIIVKILE